MNTKPYFTQAEADEIIALIKEKLRADTTKQKSIRAKIRSRGFWASEFGLRDGNTVADFLRVVKIIGSKPFIAQLPLVHKEAEPKKTISGVGKTRSQSDESYIIDLCDEVLQLKALRQHRFDFLKGDSGTRLPVDAYYPSLSIVVEFKEKQHTEEVSFFDKRQTVSGVGRGEQRRIYDQRRRDVLPRHNIQLIEFDYSEFEHSRSKKLVRNKAEDLKVITRKLKMVL